MEKKMRGGAIQPVMNRVNVLHRKNGHFLTGFIYYIVKALASIQETQEFIEGHYLLL